MGITLGSTDIPLVAPATGQACTDPLLTYLLSYFQAVANVHALAAWQAVDKGPSLVPVKSVFAHNPEAEGLSENDLPALFIWRADTTENIDLADDYELVSGQLLMQWVPFPLEQAKRRPRTAFARGLFATINAYFERGRDPAWYVPGDMYPARSDLTDAQNAANTQALGSVLGHYAKYWRCWIARWGRKVLTIRMNDGVAKTYESYLATLTIEENLLEDANRFDLVTSVDITIPAPDDGVNPALTLVEGIED